MCAAHFPRNPDSASLLKVKYTRKTLKNNTGITPLCKATGIHFRPWMMSGMSAWFRSLTTKILRDISGATPTQCLTVR